MIKRLVLNSVRSVQLADAAHFPFFFCFEILVSLVEVVNQAVLVLLVHVWREVMALFIITDDVWVNHLVLILHEACR